MCALNAPKKNKKKSARYAQCYRECWEENSLFKNWLCKSRKGKYFAYCKVCNRDLATITSGKRCLEKHARSMKHLRKARLLCPQNLKLLANDGNVDNKFMINADETYDSSETDSLSPVQLDSLSNNRTSSLKKNNSAGSAGLQSKTLDAICSFYKNINSPAQSSKTDLEDSDEAFGRYLGKELKSLKNVAVKKKLKQKILNMVYNTEDTPEESAGGLPFPIFVSTQDSIPFSQTSNDVSQSNQILSNAES